VGTEFSINTCQRVAESFDHMTFQRGLAYAKEGRVNLVDADRWPVVARVQGSSGYIVTLHYEGGRYLEGECSCPVGVDCKHAVATALVVFQREQEEDEDYRATRKEKAVGSWLAGLGQAPEERESPAPSNKLVAYVLEESDNKTLLSFHRTSRLKRGGLARSSHMTNVGDPTRRMPAWVSSEDIRRMSAVQAISRAEIYDSRFDITSLGESLFQELSEAGLLFWDEVQTRALQWGPERSERLSWQECEEDPGEFRLGLGPDLVVLPALRTLYVDHTTRSIGPLDLGIPFHVVERLIAGPSVPESMLAVAEQSLRSLRCLDPEELQLDRANAPIPVPMRPRLRISLETSSRFGDMLDVAWEAVYGEHSFPLGEWGRLGGNAPLRNMSEEGRFSNQARLLTESSEVDFAGAQGKSEVAHAAQHLALQIIPELVSQGWLCELSDDFPAETPVMDAEWIEELKPVSDGHGWFELGLDVQVNGRRVPLLPLLLQAIASGEINLEREPRRERPVGINLKLPDGSLVHVGHERLQRWLRPLIELRLRGLDKEDKLVMPGVTAVELAEAMPGRFSQSKALGELRERLEALVDLKPKQEGKGFVGELRAYQRQGLGWLRFLHEGGFGGVLADDMGLGKTVQLLAFFEGLRAARKLESSSPFLVVAPRSVVGNWHLEAQRFTPQLRSQVHLGPQRATTAEALRGSQVVITSYQTLLRDIELFLEVSWTSIVFDEAQAIKNPQTKLRRALCRLEAESRFCVTGTPIENHLGELWSQVDMVMPGVLGSASTFHTVFRRPIERQGDSRALDLLRQRIRPFLLRRSKSEVDVDLPEKSEIIERIPLDTAQRDLYESLRLTLDKEVRAALKSRGVEGASLIILDALLRLRQCCCDPRLVKIPEARKAKRSAKLDRLMGMLSELEDEGRFTLVFSQFTTMLSLIEEECKKSDIPYVKLTGQTRDREKVIRQFQDGQAPVFLISLKAGGVGLNLTRADTVIHYDPWWNPAAEKQATDRAHRIGQTKNVMVYKLVAEGTLEERICVMQKEKQQLTDSALREGGLTHFGADDLRALFQSL
jgi:superfamily II DNA or RNA helicase